MKKVILFTIMLMLSISFASAAIFSDDFNRADSQTVGNGWIEGWADDRVLISNNALRIDMISGADGRVRHAFTDEAQPYVISFDVSGTGNPDYEYDTFVACPYQGDNNGNCIGILEETEGDTGFYHQTVSGTWTTSSMLSYVPNTTYHIELIIDASIMEMDIKINNVIYASNIAIPGYWSITGIDGFNIQTANSATNIGKYYTVDNFLVTNACTPNWICQRCEKNRCTVATDEEHCGQPYDGSLTCHVQGGSEIITGQVVAPTPVKTSVVSTSFIQSIINWFRGLFK